MSASREKQNRKDMTAAGRIAPKTAREAQQRQEERRSNLLYGLIAGAFAAVVVISLIWNSNILTRSATAATVDGRKYNAAQVAFYYRNAYLGFVNQWSYALSYFGLDTSKPLDSQPLTEMAAMFLDVDLYGDEDASEDEATETEEASEEEATETAEASEEEATETAETSEDENVTETEETSEDENVTETEEASEDENVTETEEASEDEDAAETEEASEDEDVTETEEASEDKATETEEASGKTPMTWKDYFMGQALEQMASVQNALQQASDENFTFPDSVQEQYEESLATLASSARSAGTSVRRYLQATFGSIMTESVYKTELLRLMKHDAYATAYEKALTYTDEEIETAYNDDKQAYDFVSYEAVSVDGSLATETDADGNEIPAADGAAEAAKTAAKNAADALAAGVRDGGTLAALSANMEKVADASGDKDSYDTCSYTSEEFADWLFDDARKAGDVTVIESGDLYYVVKFEKRFRDETKTIDVRHILVKPEEGTLEEDDEGYQEEHDRLWAEAKTKAEELYQQWQDGEKTEESFAALAKESSEDTGSQSDGGLYERVSEGDMVTAFNDWCFDAARQPGDTDIVETDYGYHIMYYVGDNAKVRWQAQVEDTLKSEAVTEWSKSLYENAVTTQESGMKYVG